MQKEIKITPPEGYEIDKEKSTLEHIIFKEIKKDNVQEMSDFLFSILKETTAKITGEKEVTYYNSKGEWVIQQDYKIGKLWVSYYRIWQVFESKYGLNYEQIRDFINGWIETNTGWKGLTPGRSTRTKQLGIETNTGWKGLTP